MTPEHARHSAHAARGFTLVEVMIAALITVFVLGSISLSLSQIGRAKATSKERLDTFLRADAALASLRREVVSVIRADDLFLTRFLLYDDAIATPLGDMDRDELLIFNTRLRPVRNTNNFSGEGIEYETQVRIEEDDDGPVLWQRRDRVPDEYPLGGGKATPLVNGIIGLMIEAYDGRQWSSRWDSDEQGLPHAVRIMVTASGHRGPDDLYDAPIATVRTVVPIDRVPIPRDHFEAAEEALAELDAEEAPEDGADAAGGAAGGDAGVEGGGGGGGVQIDRRGGGRGGNDRGGGFDGNVPLPPAPPPQGNNGRAPRTGSLVPPGARDN